MSESLMDLLGQKLSVLSGRVQLKEGSGFENLSSEEKERKIKEIKDVAEEVAAILVRVQQTELPKAA